MSDTPKIKILRTINKISLIEDVSDASDCMKLKPLMSFSSVHDMENFFVCMKNCIDTYWKS